ncbi:MAG: hypothetical protein RMN53_04520 [Anaerolineae bacterium]|nr:hypothetical protein [Anaerolineae bacterium]
MNDDLPIVEGEPLSAEDRRLLALFDKLEEGQLDFLDAAGKRLIELSSAMLAVLFGVTAFGDKFPPPYLAGHPRVQALAVAVLACYLLALLAGVLAIAPRTYRRSRYNLSDLRRELDRLVTYKLCWFRIGLALFFVGSLALAALVGSLVLTA